jgi:ABC-type transporter Mla MlaB component
MATKDTSAGSGLLSKVVKFVRHPTKDWSALDQPEPAQDSGYSKQSLKEMIERKRQNDFVRRREFDQLRKLRRNEPIVASDQADRPSSFHSSMASNQDERATTIKKIDEIEAQMSKQWWKGKHDDAATPAAGHKAASPTMQSGAEKTDETFEPTQTSDLNTDSNHNTSIQYESTQMGLAAREDFDLQKSESKPTVWATGTGLLDASVSGFSISKLFSAELSDAQADPDLEEAAIRFANGDDAGAEAGLLAVLQQADTSHPESADGCAAALFDLYRATGQQASFDRVAIDYAQRFGRSAPAWFSLPELLGHKSAKSPAARPWAPDAPFEWKCPAQLDNPSVQALADGLTQATGLCVLDWSRLQAITPQAGQVLAQLFERCCAQPMQMRFRGADILEKQLRSLTPSGQRQVDTFWWALRLDALRMLRLQDEFELAALDYCVTFEVSPPPWENALCDCIAEQGGSAGAYDGSMLSFELSGNLRGLGDQTGPTIQPLTTDAAAISVVELSGDVLGDAADALDQLQAGLQGGDRLVISCAHLIRVDFSAAGSILNWVAMRQAEGCQVQFREVPRLVAAFFNVIGINEHARVVVRTG